MNKRVLFVATVDRGHILKFHIPYLKYFKDKGFEVHVACAGNADIPYCDKKYELPFERSPFKFSNYKAYSELKKIVNENNYSLIHCHTPMGAVIGRMASKAVRKKGTKVLYTAHGFHFYKGASIINWLLFYPIEKYLSSYTDCLITINNEDFQNVIKKNFKAKAVELVFGVGINLTKFQPPKAVEKAELRKKFGYKQDDFILFYPADLNHNKNQKLLINGIERLKSRIPNVKLLLAGEGPLEEQYKKMVEEKGVVENIHFLGFRVDIPELIKIADLSVSASKREGLPVNVMEAMATGLPLVVSNCRGNRDLVVDGENGFVFENETISGFVDAVWKLYDSELLRQKFGHANIERVKQYSLASILNKMDTIYSNYI
jgi:glycosyltransferase EpsD